MRRRGNRVVGFCLFSLVLTYAAAAQGALALEDQFGRKLDIASSLRSGLCVVVAGNARDAPARLARWQEALLASRLADAPILQVCDLSGVPFFVPKASIMRGLKKEYPDTRLILDWKGEFRRRVPLEEAEIVVAFFRDGVSVASVSGDADAERLKLLAEASR